MFYAMMCLLHAHARHFKEHISLHLTHSANVAALIDTCISIPIAVLAYCKTIMFVCEQLKLQNRIANGDMLGIYLQAST